MRHASTHALLLASLFLSTGCLTMQHGGSQIVPIDSEPPGVTVGIEPGGAGFETPGQAALERRSSYIVTFEKEGFQRQTTVIESKTSWQLWRNVIWVHPIGWVIGIMIDVASGAAHDLEPESVFVTLEPVVVVPTVEGAAPNS